MNGFDKCMMQCGSICSGSHFTVYEGLAGSTHPLLPTSHWIPTEIADSVVLIDYAAVQVLILAIIRPHTYKCGSQFKYSRIIMFCSGPVKLHAALHWIRGRTPGGCKSC